MTKVKLTISLKRVQTFIFEVPRLKAMLGANALIGQVMRHELAELLTGGASLSWPDGLASEIPEDPLDETSDRRDRDDPKALYQAGILARDGGHFIVVFDDQQKAENFRKSAEEVLARDLPGVLYDLTIEPFNENRPHEEERAKKVREPREVHLMDLPVLQVCEETGKAPASEQMAKSSSWASRSVIGRMESGDRFYRGKTEDIIGLIHGALYPSEMGWDPPDDLKDLTAGSYIAVIHADGNEIGSRYKDVLRGWDAADITNQVAREAHGEAFFHSLRVIVRRAVVAALRNTFRERNRTRPYEVLMLGGDDLLLVCRADRALEFALNYVRELQGHVLTDGARLDVALGVAIAKPTYPIHRLHELAESLASSAKRLYRSLTEDRNSVIDWQVVTQSWFSGVEEARREKERIVYSVGERGEESLLLTGRPYRVVGTSDSLEHLLASVKRLDGSDDSSARSPLRSLRRACEQGRLAGGVAFDRLPERTRAALGGKLWEEVDEGSRTYLTRALDIVGITEISRLGRQRNG